MIVYIDVGADDYVIGWSTNKSNDSDVKLDLNDSHEFFKSDFNCWKYENNELIFDEIKQQKIINEHEKEQNKLNQDDLNTLAIFELAQQIENMKGGK